MVDQDRFARAYERTVCACRDKKGIGTLGEKTLHALLKDYFEPDRGKQEIRLEGYYADIYNGEEIIEIQTCQFNKLRGKLAVFLKDYPVTVVYPVEERKRLYWLDRESGEISGGRLSPRKGNVYQICPELYKIKDFLKNPNLRLHVIVLEVEEYRILDGWSRDRKRGATRRDRIPKKLNGELCIASPGDYRKLVPEGLPDEFGSMEFAAAAHISRRLAQVALNILYELGTVERTGKKGNAWLYRCESRLPAQQTLCNSAEEPEPLCRRNVTLDNKNGNAYNKTMNCHMEE